MGHVIDTPTKRILQRLSGVNKAAVQCEMMLEIDSAGDVPIRDGDQLDVGRVGPGPFIGHCAGVSSTSSSMVNDEHLS